MKKGKYNSNKYIFFLFIFSLFILFIFFKQNTKISENSNNINIIRQLYSNEINYKGEKIYKEKLLNNYLMNISDEFIFEKNQERERFNNYYYLYDYSSNPIIKSRLKSKFLEYISKQKNKTITQLDIFYISYILNFGNNLLQINNAIFYCELVGCHKIILNNNINNNLGKSWLITKPIYIKNTNITIIQGSNVDCKSNTVLCFYEISWCIYYPKIIIPQVRTGLIKSEILRNLPKVNIELNDLFIHIRGGDIFQTSIGINYAQPPLCYYEKVLNDYNKLFKNIHIISVDHSNIVVDTLLDKYKHIIYKKNNLETDISLLSHAYNIVASVSSFAFSAIKLNDNLINLWEFDMIRLSNKLLFLHHHIFNFKIKYNIFTMKPSEVYRKKMFGFKNTSSQYKLMLEDKCPYNFTITKPTKY